LLVLPARRAGGVSTPGERAHQNEQHLQLCIWRRAGVQASLSSWWPETSAKERYAEDRPIFEEILQRFDARRT